MQTTISIFYQEKQLAKGKTSAFVPKKISLCLGACVALSFISLAASDEFFLNAVISVLSVVIFYVFASSAKHSANDFWQVPRKRSIGMALLVCFIATSLILRIPSGLTILVICGLVIHRQLRLDQNALQADLEDLHAMRHKLRTKASHHHNLRLVAHTKDVDQDDDDKLKKAS